ncbi:MAG TPA: hypothetical protein VN688_20420 [Gemmataceae bacterium]|nr:hypothetical protein [Gemmataceae bacterium]
MFLDANTLIYHFTAHARYGAACTRLAERIEQLEIRGFTSAHALGDVAHRLMTIEAMTRLGWPANGLAARFSFNAIVRSDLREYCLTLSLEVISSRPE